MRIFILALGIVATLFRPIPAADPAAAVKAVAPYLDDATVAVARLDVTALEAAEERLTKLAGANANLLADARRAVRDAVAALRKAGASEVYAVVSMSDLPQPGPFLLVPRAEADDEALKKVFAAYGPGHVEPLDGMMFAGFPATRERLRNLKPAARQELEAAFAAIGGAALQIAIVPGADQRRVAGELAPPLPPQLGGGPAAPLAEKFRWAALGVTTTPSLGVKLVIRADDAAAAKAYETIINRGLDWVGRDKEALKVMPKYAAIRPALTPKVEGDRLTISVDESSPGVVDTLASELATMAAKARSAAGRTQSVNNVKQIALAWHNYVAAYNTTFPDSIKSKDGKPLLSWRVAILPFIEQNDLYKQFKLDEPWDSEHNKTLVAKMPAVYRSPAQKVGNGKTTYLAPTGTKDKVHFGALGARLRDIVDGTSNTIMIVEANDEAAVVWTKPDDLVVDPKEPLKGLMGHYDNMFIAGFADGSVRSIMKAVKPATLIALFTRDGGEVVEDGF